MLIFFEGLKANCLEEDLCEEGVNWDPGLITAPGPTHKNTLNSIKQLEDKVVMLVSVCILSGVFLFVPKINFKKQYIHRHSILFSTC